MNKTVLSLISLFCFLLTGCPDSFIEPEYHPPYPHPEPYPSLGDEDDDGEDDLDPVVLSADCFQIKDGILCFSFDDTTEHFSEAKQKYRDTGLTLFTQSGTGSIGFGSILFMQNKSSNLILNSHGIIFAREGDFDEGDNDVEFIWVLLKQVSLNEGVLHAGYRTLSGEHKELNLAKSTIPNWNTSGNELSVMKTDSRNFTLMVNGEEFPIETDRNFEETGFGFFVELSSLELSLFEQGYDLHLEISGLDPLRERVDLPEAVPMGGLHEK